MDESVHTGEQRNVSTVIDRGLYHMARSKSFISPISRSVGRPTKEGPSHDPKKVDVKRNTSIIRGRKIPAGEKANFTMRTKGGGEAAYGDSAPKQGKGATYHTIDVMVNSTKSPRIPVEGKESQAVFKQVTNKLPDEARNDCMEWTGEEIDKSAIQGWVHGANKALLIPRTSGGKGMKLGNFGTAGVAQMCPNFFVAGQGFLPFVADQSTWNGSVNTAINNLTAGVSTRIDLKSQTKFKSTLNKLGVRSPQMGKVRGKKIRAINFCDPSIVLRMKDLMGEKHEKVGIRGEKNPIFTSDDFVIWQEMLYLPVEQLEAFRPVYDLNLGRPRWGADMHQEHRDHVEETPNRFMITVGHHALLETYRGRVKTTINEGAHDTGMDYVNHFSNNFVRPDWWALDENNTKSNACKNNSVVISVFTEDEF